MIDSDRWINSLPKTREGEKQEFSQINPKIWVKTISKKNKFNSIKKYSFLSVLFVSGLVLVSVIKNETRNLQKEITNLQSSINILQLNLNNAILDSEVITSPENISLLAKDYLATELVAYKKSQIKDLNSRIQINANKNEKKLINIDKSEKKFQKSVKKNKNLIVNVKSQIVKKMESKKTEIRKLQELYSNPKALPKEIKVQVAKEIKQKKTELKNIYNSPKETITLEKTQRWAVVQLVKAFLGMPMIPGR